MPLSWFGLFAVSGFVTICGRLLAADSTDNGPTIRELKDACGHVIAIEAGMLPAGALAKLSQRSDADEALSRVLSVSVDGAAAAETAIIGSYSLHGDALRFTPRFAFRAGQAYCAVLHPSEVQPAVATPAVDVIHRFHEPAEASAAPAEVMAIFPSTAILPENQLRFYIHFSAPMSRGAAYDCVRLLDGRNRAIDLPFLELGEELWDPQQQRLTLMIDPGRIKRGVKPREDLGPVLRAGEEFTLVIRSTWLDAQNRPLRQEATKHFRVCPPIEAAIDPAQWQIQVPPSGSRQPLAIDFPRPLDHALLQRLLTVRSASGAEIQGEVLVGQEERRWELWPTNPWLPGRFEVLVDNSLEDLAGNRIGQPFEVNAVGLGAKQLHADPVRLGFEIPGVP